MTDEDYERLRSYPAVIGQELIKKSNSIDEKIVVVFAGIGLLLDEFNDVIAGAQLAALAGAKPNVEATAEPKPASDCDVGSGEAVNQLVKATASLVAAKEALTSSLDAAKKVLGPGVSDMLGRIEGRLNTVISDAEARQCNDEGARPKANKGSNKPWYDTGNKVLNLTIDAALDMVDSKNKKVKLALYGLKAIGLIGDGVRESAEKEEQHDDNNDEKRIIKRNPDSPHCSAIAQDVLHDRDAPDPNHVMQERYFEARDIDQCHERNYTVDFAALFKSRDPLSLGSIADLVGNYSAPIPREFIARDPAYAPVGGVTGGGGGVTGGGGGVTGGGGGGGVAGGGAHNRVGLPQAVNSKTAARTGAASSCGPAININVSGIGLSAEQLGFKIQTTCAQYVDSAGLTGEALRYKIQGVCGEYINGILYGTSTAGDSSPLPPPN